MHRFLLSRVARLLGLVTLWFAASLAPAARAADPICARVKIEIEQELTFEREAFEARMTINNGLAGATLTDVAIDVIFADEDGNPVVASSNPNYDPDAPGAPKFFIRLQDGFSIPASIAGETSASIRWLIIPAANAGGELPQGELYQVGATLSYRLNGVGDPEVITVTPDFIYVKPQPRLTLDYFLPREVNGDDPFTVPIEEPVPFSLGVRIINTGYGPAKNLKIDSSQPKIIENEQGLLVNFVITGSEVHGLPAQPTLLADFGTIAPGATKIARWIMECSLYGTFVEFTASFTHADDLGGQLTSLIRPPIKTHLMLNDVLVDLPGRDAVRDFLAHENHNVPEGQSHGPIYAFESDTGTVDTPVSDVSSGTTLTGGGTAFTLTPTTPATGMLFAKKTNPLGATAVLRSAVRSDGYALPATNYWLSKTYDKAVRRYDHFVNLFDAANPAGLPYNLTFGAPDSINRPPVFSALTERVIPAGALLAMTIQAFDPDGTELTMTLDAPPAGATLEFTSYVGGYTTYTLRWQPMAGGTFPIGIRATDGQFDVAAQATVIVTGDPANLFAAWMERHGLTDPASDLDRDGLDARLEYALDLDPTTPDRRRRITFDIVEVGPNAFLAVTFEMRTDDPRLIVAVEGASSPRSDATWTPQTTEITVDQTGVPSHLRRVQIRDSVPIETGSAIRRFLQLRATFQGE